MTFRHRKSVPAIFHGGQQRHSETDQLEVPLSNQERVAITFQKTYHDLSQVMDEHREAMSELAAKMDLSDSNIHVPAHVVLSSFMKNVADVCTRENFGLPSFDEVATSTRRNRSVRFGSVPLAKDDKVDAQQKADLRRVSSADKRDLRNSFINEGDDLPMRQSKSVSVGRISATRKELRPTPAKTSNFGQCFGDVCTQKCLFTMSSIMGKRQAEQNLVKFRATVQEAADAIYSARGGCAIAIARVETLDATVLQHGIEFAPVDCRSGWEEGYMTSRIRGKHVASKEFVDALVEFSEHSDSDRWPDGHEAAGLPKDGFIVVDSSGECLMAAVKIEGLPAAELAWAKHGMRHQTALALMELLRFRPAAVLVRSDGGGLHGLAACDGEVEAVSAHISVIDTWLLELERHFGV